MRKITTAAAVAALLVSGAGVPAAAAPAFAPSVTASKSDCGYYPKTSVNLRSGPGTQYKALGLLAPDDRLEVTKKRGGWYRVEVNTIGRSVHGLREGTKGWVAKRYVRPATCMQLN